MTPNTDAGAAAGLARTRQPRLAVCASTAGLRDQIVEALARDGLATDLEMDDPFALAGGALAGARLPDPPDVFVLGCELAAIPAGVLREVRRELPATRIVLVIAQPPNGSAVRTALRSHVDAIVRAPHVEAALGPTVRAVLAEQVVFPREERRHVELMALSFRERQVLRLVVTGSTNDQIADEMFLATSTVKSHLTSAFAKLGVQSRSEAAALLLDPDEPIGRAVLRDAGLDLATAGGQG